MSAPRSYRSLAEGNLDKTGEMMRDFPDRGLPSDLAAAKFAQAQVVATVALVQALLHVGDVLREGFIQSGFDAEVD